VLRDSSLPIVAALALALLLTACTREAEEEEAVRVVFVPVQQRDVTIFANYVGRTEASERVEVNPRVDGFLEEIAFVEGSTVIERATLYRIDARPYQANVDRAEAVLASRQAQLEKFKRDVARIGPLFEEDAASQLDYDEAVSAVETGEANVREAEAELARAELELAYTEIKAPIGGVIGASDVDVGALIRAGGSEPLTTVSRIDPIYVNYAMSALDYLNARRRVRSYWEQRRQEMEGKALEGEVSITLPDDSVYRYKGRVGFTDPQVNPETGTFAVRAIVPNPDKELLPGQYTRVRMPLEVRRAALLIPEESIIIEQGGVYVKVVLPNNRVEQRLIFVGPSIEGELIVEKGLEAEERIIVHGINKVYHGALADPVTMADFEAELESERAAQVEVEKKVDQLRQEMSDSADQARDVIEDEAGDEVPRQ
jgi:membrane fusion protein (multidrug efflux system)